MSPDELLAYCLAKPGAWDDEICGSTRLSGESGFGCVVAEGVRAR